MERFPPWLTPKALYSREEEPANSGWRLYAKAVIHLEQLQVQWYIERLKWRRKGNNSQVYYSKATKIMDALIEIWEAKDQLIDFQCYFDWMVSPPLRTPFCLDPIQS